MHGSGRRRTRIGCAAGITAAFVLAPGPLVAQEVPPPGSLDTIRMSVKDRHDRHVFDMQFTLRQSTRNGGFLASGRVRISPDLCEAAYVVQFSIAPNKGRERSFPYPARMRSAKLDGVAKRCPFSGLPRRGLESLSVRATVAGRPLVRFDALPAGRRGDPLARLLMPELRFSRANIPLGVARATVRARYRAHRSHTVSFAADTGIELPRG
jgi:hypothetical protein